jgi:hypothetical protein
MSSLGDLLLSCWTIEASRSIVLDARGHADPALRAAERARILARRTHAEGVSIRPEFAREHAQWMVEVAGMEDETGPIGWFFLQRLGAYVDLHIADVLPPGDRERLIQLGASDSEEVGEAVARQGVPLPPPPEWPAAPSAEVSGDVRARIALLADPHVGIEASDVLIPTVVEDINRDAVDLTIALGDLTQSGKGDQFAKAREILERLSSRWLVTLGNHDMWGFGGSEAQGLKRFTQVFQRKPYAIFETKGVNVIMIDSADPTASPFPPFDLVTGSFADEPKEALPGGRISEEVAQWMASIPSNGPTFIVLHHPPYPYLGFPPIVFGLDAASTELLADLVRRTQAWGVFCGHSHRCALYNFAGVPLVEVPCSKEWPFGYGVLEVSDEGWAYNLRPVSDQALVKKESAKANILFRRYAQGPDEARAFSLKRADLPWG